jgi:hypothetical protein
MQQPSRAAAPLVGQMWWRLSRDSDTALEGMSPVSWDRLRFMKLRRIVLGEDRVCPDRNNSPLLSEAIALDELFSRALGADAASPSGGGSGINGASSGANGRGGPARVAAMDDASVEREFQLLGEELLLRDIDWPNTRRCPLDFLTSHESVAWDMPGVKVPRIGCKNYWVRGRPGGSSEWSAEEQETATAAKKAAER